MLRFKMADCCLQDEALTFSPTLYPTAPLTYPQDQSWVLGQVLTSSGCSPSSPGPVHSLPLGTWEYCSGTTVSDRIQMGEGWGLGFIGYVAPSPCIPSPKPTFFGFFTLHF